MGKVSNIYTQSFPPPPTFTEQQLGDLKSKVLPTPTSPVVLYTADHLPSKVLIVTGGASGVGLELVKLLYQKNGTVYVAGRSREKGMKAIHDIQALFPSSTGRLEFLLLDLEDLTGIRRSAEDFMGREKSLHVLWNNAGVALPPEGSKSKQVRCMQRQTSTIDVPMTDTRMDVSGLRIAAGHELSGPISLHAESDSDLGENCGYITAGLRPCHLDGLVVDRHGDAQGRHAGR